MSNSVSSQERSWPRFNVSPLLPEAQPIVQAVADVYFKHLRDWLLCMLVHGSAYKGGFIPNCSDIDFQIYLQESAFDEHQALPLDRALALHRDLAQIDPSPFLCINTYLFNPHSFQSHAKGWTPPISGTYHCLFGQLPVDPATAEQILQRACLTIEENSKISARLSGKLMQHGDNKLAREVRLLCTDVWPTLYSVLSLHHRDRPLEPWRLPKDKAIALLPEDQPLGQAFRYFHRCVTSYYNQTHNVEQALQVIDAGANVFQHVEYWYQEWQKDNVL